LGEPPPDELVISWDCQRYHALPDAGGYYDQEWQLMDKMSRLDNIYSTVARVRNMHGKQIHGMTATERRVMRYLKYEGMV